MTDISEPLRTRVGLAAVVAGAVLGLWGCCSSRGLGSAPSASPSLPVALLYAPSCPRRGLYNLSPAGGRRWPGLGSPPG